MEGNNQYPGEIEIIKKADTVIIDNISDGDKTVINILRDEVSQLKATNASLNVKLQTIRKTPTQYFFS